jgi:hypothetical protein
VSRLFPDEIGVFVGLNKIMLVRQSGGLKSKPVAEDVVPVHSADPRDWSPALAALATALEAPEWQRANARVVLSDCWAHYELLPFSIELSRDSEQIEHARYLLASTYGDVAEEWSIALSDEVPGAPRLICAVPTELLTELQTLFSVQRLTLLSLQPQMVVAYNLWRQALPKGPAWFATIGEGSLVAMHLREGRCDRVRSVRISANWEVELKRIQTVGRLSQSQPTDGPVFVDAPLHVRALAANQPPNVHWLDSEAPAKGTLGRLAALKELHT